MNFQLFSRYIYKTIFHKSPGYQWGRFSFVPSKENAHKLPKNIKFFESASPVALEQVTSSMQIYLDFITETEEQKLLDEVEHVLKRIRYETSHWDDAIHNYRETEHLRWKPDNQKIIERVRQTAFASNAKHIKYVHILDIAKDGFIKPHVDSVRVSLQFQLKLRLTKSLYFSFVVIPFQEFPYYQIRLCVSLLNRTKLFSWIFCSIADHFT